MNKLQQLKEDYERRAEAAERRYHATPLPRQSDVLGKMRANIYRDFASELDKLMPEEAPEDEECRCCGSNEGMSGEDELCDNCFANDPNQD